MEAIRKYIDADSLMTVMKLPEKFRNCKLEVIIFWQRSRRKCLREWQILIMHYSY